MTFDEAMWIARNNKIWMEAEYNKFITQHEGYYTTSTNTNNRMVMSATSGLHGDGAKALLDRFSGSDAAQYLRPGIDAATAKAYERQLNITLAVFNLLPVPPLDGSRIVDGIMPARLRGYWETYVRYAQIALILVIYGAGSLLAGPLGVLNRGMFSVISAVAGY